MSYYNYSMDSSADVNGGSYNRDPRLSGNAAQYQSSVDHSGQGVCNYGGQVYQQGLSGNQNYVSQYGQSVPSTAAPNTSSDPNYPYYLSQNTQQTYYQTNTAHYPQTNYPQYPEQQQQTYYDQQYPIDPHYQDCQLTESQTQRYIYDLSLPDEIDPDNCISTRSDEELWVEAWLARLGKIQIKLDSTIVVNSRVKQTQTKQPRNVAKQSISDARANLSKAFKVLSSIETVRSHLNLNLSSLSSDEWRHSTEQIGALRDELSVLMTPFEGDSFVALKRLVRLRRKKRISERRQRMERKTIRERDRETRVKKHEEIDTWLEMERMAEQRMQEEEAAKREGDIFLADTMRKKHDAKRNLALVQALTKLRDVRDKAALGRGEQTSAQDKYAFQNLAERLQEIWTNALKEYVKEEHRLRTQLEQTTSEDQRKAKIEREKKVTDDWSRALFGEPLKEGDESGLYLGLTAAERNVDTFIAIRKSWDTFLTKPDDLLGSKIPIGWVLPKEHVTDKWSQYLPSNSF